MTWLTRLCRDTAFFAPCYVVLDWASFIDPLGPFNITPWNPQAALAVVWMTLAGLRNAPIVALTILCADYLVRHAPAGPAVSLLGAAVLTSGYMLIAFCLHRLVQDTALRSTREVTLFVATSIAGSALVSAAFTGLLSAGALLPDGSFGNAWFRYWVGDAVGILVTAPILLAAADAGRRSVLMALFRKPEALLQGVVLALTVWLVFRGFGHDPSRQFYLLFLPLIWAAVRFGLNGAIVAIATVQMGVVIGVHGEAGLLLPVLELQALIAALTLTGLYLGVAVDQRQAAEHTLRESLRLAAAGEMAGAIAHEVNQPLTAVANYSMAVQRLLERNPPAWQEALEVAGRIQLEAGRAGEIVRRLRDFFRAGTMRLAILPAEELVRLARQVGERSVQGRNIRFELEAASGLPPLLADSLQLEVVLRNLLENAAESVAQAGVAEGCVRVRLESTAGHLRLAVSDNGPGPGAGMRGRLFRPFASGKSAGMGLGLAVSRAIAEAHGGSLELRDARHGEFHLDLPWAKAA